MEVINLEGTLYSLIPAVLMLVLVLWTRKLLLSLGTGIIVGALLIHDFDILLAIQQIWLVFRDIFYTTDGWNVGNFYLLVFLILLGIMTVFMTASGGSKAFGDWAINKIKTRKNAQIMPFALGILIFIDDYFNSLAVGQIARPVTDRHKISRAKLAYFIDSTSAPVTVITPISSWGAYIIGTLGSIFVANEIVEYQPLEAFVKMIPYNIYALVAIVFVLLVALLNINIGAMKKHEKRALRTGEVLDPAKNIAAVQAKEVHIFNKHGKIIDLVIPIAVLIVATVAAMLVTGKMALDEEATVLKLFENTNVNLSLFVGGLFSVITALLLYLRLPNRQLSIAKISWKGTLYMMPAIYILVLAWMIGAIIEIIDTGGFLAQLIDKVAFNPDYLALLLFILAGFMALATGTSWGTFGIMLPIAAQIAVLYDVSYVIPAMAAVLAGSVFGDHCSPISDTSILSSTGAGSDHMDHVITQLPYAFISALAAGIGYLFLGITDQIGIALLMAFVTILLFVVWFIWNKRQSE